MCGEKPFGLHIPRKCTELRHFYSCRHSLGRIFRKSVSATAETGGENYNCLCQNSTRKYEDGLEH